MKIIFEEKEFTITLIEHNGNDISVIIDDHKYDLPPYVMSVGEYPLNIYEWLISNAGPFAGGKIYKDLEKEKEYRLSHINLIRDQKLSSGFKSKFGLIDTDDKSTKNIMGMYQKAILSKVTNSNLNISWKMKDNSVIELSRDEFIDLGDDVLEFSQKCYAYSWILKEAISKCDNYDTLDAINILDGWPE